MNMNGLVNMIIRIVMRRFVGQGINAGINAVSGSRRKKRRPPQEEAGDTHSAPDSGKATKRARQSMRMMRRGGRM